MAQSFDIDGACPVCGDMMHVTRLQCDRCGSALEGSFHLHQPSERAPERTVPLANGRDAARFGRLARLDDAQLEFVEAFLRCRGVIKNVEDMLGISYPTVRARLASALDAMGFGADDDGSDADRRRTRRDILEKLAAGQITTEEAHRLLALAQSADDGEV